MTETNEGAKLVNINTLANDVRYNFSRFCHFGESIDYQPSGDFQKGFELGVKSLQQLFLREFPGVHKTAREIWQPHD